MFARRLTLSLFAILGFALLAGAFLLLRAVRTYWIDDLTRSLTVQANLTARQIVPREFNAPGRGLEFNRLARQLGEACGCRVTFVRLDGRVIGDTQVTDRDLAEVANYRTRPEIQAAVYGRAGSAVRRSGTMGVEALYAAVPLKGAVGEPAGIVRLAVPIDEVDKKIFGLQKIIVSVLLSFFAASAGFLLWFSGNVRRSVGEISDVATRLLHKDYSARFLGESDDDLGRLGGTLNHMAETIQSTVQELSQEKKQLTSVLSNMVEAVVSVDGAGRILTMNPALSALFNVQFADAVGRPVFEVLRNGRIEKLIQKTIETGQTRVDEAAIRAPEEKLFEVTAVPLINDLDPDGALLVFHDITRLRKLEKVRKDFVANVSHELRTPLAAIKGYAETLESGGMDDKKNRMDFVSAITRHVDRMSRLVEELLELAALESGALSPKKEKISVLETAREVAKSLKKLAERNRVTIEIPGSNEDSPVPADPTLIRQVLINLIENAIKFSLEGGKVVLWTESKEGVRRFFIRDSGIGISEGDLPRLFERFYRADKARSREVGGTGLGLSIAKHIIEAHGGDVGVDSVENQGSTFWFDLPLS